MNQPTGGIDIWDMRPKLRHDVVFLDAPTGAYLRGADSAFLLKGRTAFRWLSTLSPYLTGQHTLAELCASLDDGQRETVATLVRALITRGFAKDAGPSSASADPSADRFAGQVEFIDHFTDEAGSRFLRFRTARVVLAGRGSTLLAAATGLLRNGCLNVAVHPLDDPDPYRDALQEVSEEFATDQQQPEITVHTGLVDPTSADVVVFCGDLIDTAAAHDLARKCHAAGPLFVPVIRGSKRSVLGPVAGRSETPCWLCAQLRLNANAEPAVAAEAWRQLAIGPATTSDRGINEVTARMVGNAAAFEVFRVLTGAFEGDAVATVLIVDLDTLESTREQVLPHPSCPLCRDTDEPEPPARSEPETDEEIYERAHVLVSPFAGVFARFTDDPLEQAPLKTARLRFATVDGPRELTAFDVSTVMAARLNAYRVTVRDYVARVAPRDFGEYHSGAHLIESGRCVVPWTELTTATGAADYTPDRRLYWMPAQVIGTDETVWVPTAFALPTSVANLDGYAEQTVAGAAVDATLAGVISQGLASALAYEAVTATIRQQAAIAAVPEEDLALDPDSALVLKAAGHFGQQLSVFTFAGAAPAHAILAVCDTGDAGAPVWSIATGTSLTRTRLAAISDVVGTLQVRHFEGTDPDLGSALIPDFDPRTAMSQAAAADADPAFGSDSTTTADMLAQLAERGLTALFIETTTRDLRSSGAFRAGTVLLWRRSAAA